MSLKSMTGFSRTTSDVEKISLVIEARSVNGRGLDIKTRQPSGFEIFERLAKDIGKSFLARGQINLVLTIEGQSSLNNISVNREVLSAYLKISQELTDAGMTLTPSADGILGLKGVIDTLPSSITFGEEKLAFELAPAVTTAFKKLVESRESEGRSLFYILNQHLTTLKALVDSAENVSGEQANIIKDRFYKKLEELALDASSIEERLAQEVTLATIKVDIKEELDRLRSHISQAEVLLNEDNSQGRKLDFLAQELMREANTLCSKSASIDLTRIGLDIKVIIDQFREQCQNVE